MLVARLIAGSDASHMATRKNARPGEGIPADVKKAEGRALHNLWKLRKRRTQAAFAADLEVTQGYLPQFFSGHRPLTLDLAQRFCEELDIELHQFSPRLAKAFDAELAASQWPFHGFSRQDYLLLSPGQRVTVEGVVMGFLTDKGVISSRKLRLLK